MPKITFNGREQYVPGVYDRTLVRSSLPGPLPALHIPVIIGHAPDGRPYDAEETAEDVETGVFPWELCGTPGAVAEYFGRESELHRASRRAWQHGLPFAYVVNIDPLTRAQVVMGSTGSAEQIVIKSRKYGAPNNAIRYAYNATTDTFTIAPVALLAMVGADVAANGTRVYVRGNHSWLQEGRVVYVADNAQAPVQVTIADSGTEIDANNQIVQWFTTTTAITAGLQISEYAMVFVTDETGLVVGTGLDTPQAVLDWINTDPSASEYLVAVKHANFDNTDLVTVANSWLGWTTTDFSPTAAVSPTGGTTELEDWVNDMNAREWARFAVTTQTLPQAYLLADSLHAMHVVMRDYAVAERGRGYPISVTAGVGWGDTVLDAGDSTDPRWRAAQLNSQDFALVALGMAREGAHLSRAPAVFGRRVAGGPGHNLTNDTFVSDEPEVLWDEINSQELTNTLKSGVISIKLSVGQSIQYTLSQGLSTLQANGGAIWNEVDSTTWSLMQRDLADFVNKVIKQDLESLQIGANGVTAATVGAVLSRRVQRSLQRQGYVLDFSIQSITLNDAGSGWDVAWSVRLPTTSDFITVTTTILIGD